MPDNQIELPTYFDADNRIVFAPDVAREIFQDEHDIEKFYLGEWFSITPP